MSLSLPRILFRSVPEVEGTREGHYLLVTWFKFLHRAVICFVVVNNRNYFPIAFNGLKILRTKRQNFDNTFDESAILITHSVQS